MTFTDSLAWPQAALGFSQVKPGALATSSRVAADVGSAGWQYADFSATQAY